MLKEKLQLTFIGILAGLFTASAALPGDFDCQGQFAKVLNDRLASREESSLIREWNRATQNFDGGKSFEPQLQKLAQVLKTKRSEGETGQVILFGQKVASVDLRLVDGPGLKIRPKFNSRRGGDGIVVEVQFGRDGIKNPFQVARALHSILRLNPDNPWAVLNAFPELNGFHQGHFHSFYEWLTVFSDAAHGDPMAQARLKLDEVNGMMKILALAEKDAGEGYELFKNVTPDSVRQTLDQFKGAAKTEILANVEQIRSAVVKRKEEIARLSSQSFSVADLEPLVAKNDRAGVVKLVSSQLPWSIMSPSEKSFWQSWMNSVLHPSSNKTLVYRGFDAKPQKKNAEGRMYALSRFFFQNRDQNPQISFVKDGHAGIEKRLSSVNFDSGKLLDPKDRANLESLPTDITDYMEGGLKGISFNFSYDPSLSFSFASNNGRHYSMGAFKIDRDRLMLNLTSPYVTEGGQVEREIHTPLMIFPDEVVLYEEGEIPSEDQIQGGRKTLQAFLGKIAKVDPDARRSNKERDVTMVQEAVRRLAKELGIGPEGL